MVLTKRLTSDSFSTEIDEIDQLATTIYFYDTDKIYKYHNFISKPRLKYKNHDIYDSNNTFRRRTLNNRSTTVDRYNYYFDYDSINGYNF